MSATFAASLHRSPPAMRDYVRRELQAGSEMLFSIVFEDDFRAVSHSIRRVGRRYFVWGASCEEIGAYATIAGANAAGFAASAEALHHGL